MTSLYRVIRKLVAADKHSDEFYQTYVHSVRYLCGCIHAFDFQHLLKTLPIKVSAKRFRLELHRQRYLSLDLKLFVMDLARVRGLTREYAKEFPGIEPRDKTLCYHIVSGLSWVRKELKERLTDIKPDNKMLKIDGVLSLFNDTYQSVLRYVKGLVYAKMRFLVKSENVEFQDLHNEVMAKVYNSLISLVPTAQPIEYVVNYLKRSAHNHVVNMIKSATTQKRARLVNVGLDKNNQRQFSMLCTSQNQLTLTDEDGKEVMPEGVDTSSAEFELQYSISEVVDSLEKRPKKQRFVTILMGSDDEEFSQWLREHRLASDREDHVDVQDRTEPRLFNKHVADFLRVSQASAESFLERLKAKLQPA